MTTLSARYIKQGRHVYHCDWCERRIIGGHIYLYGMAHETEKPYGMRQHVECCSWEPKIVAALKEAGLLEPDITRDSGGNNDAEDRYMLR